MGDVGACPRCSAASAEDQRYCLTCGARLAARGSRDPAVLLANGGGPADGAAARPGATRPEPRRLALASMALLAAGAVLGAALSPAPSGTLAAAAEQVVVVMASPPAPPTVTPAEEPAAPEPVDPPAGAAGELASAAPPVNPPAPPPAPPAPAPAQTEPEEPAPQPAPEKPTVGHVFLVVLPGAGYDAAFGPEAPAGYLRDELVPRGQLLSGYSAIGPGGLANRIALVSGQEPTPQTELGCPAYDGVAGQEGCVYPPETKTVADQLATYGLEWREYAGAEPQRDCARPDPLNPFVYFHSLIDLSDCSRSLVELERLGEDLEAVESTPVLSYITPDPGADAAATDALLREWIPAILRSPAYREDGLLAITFDSAPPALDPTAAEPEERVGALVLSPFARTGTANDRAYDHYSLLRTVQDQLGFEALGLAKEARGFGKDVFEPTLNLEPERRL